MYLEDAVVETDHGHGGYVEAEHGRVDEERFVVERALVFHAARRVVQAGDDGRGDGDAHQPHEAQHQVDAVGVLVARVLKRLCHRNEPVLIQHKTNKLSSMFFFFHFFTKMIILNKKRSNNFFLFLDRKS